MHDPHDDPLERELQALSSYTGSPPEPPLWQTALEMHRAEQQRRLWVWVRRPMPAVAAAALAVLVAAVALDPVANLRGRVVHTSDLSDTALDAARFRHADGAAGPGATRTGGPASGAAGVRLDTVNDKLEPVSRTVNPSPPAAVDPAPAAQPDTLRSGRDQPRRVDRAAGGGGAPSPVDAAPKKEAGDSPNTPADLAAGRGPDAAPRPAAPAAPPSPAPAPSGSAGTPNVDKVGNRRVNDFGERAGTNAEFFSNEPYEVAANIRLGVNDISTFYNVIPRLVDVKSGETYSNSAIPNEPLPGNAPLNAEVLNVQLRVNEQRLPEVIEELRKTGNLQIESSQVPPKEDRLKQIESALKQQEVEVKAVMAESKSKSDSKTYKGERPEKAEDGAAVLQQKAQQRLSMLNSQRARIEQGADFAYVNIQAVSEQQQAGAAAPPTLVAPSAPAGSFGAGASGRGAEATALSTAAVKKPLSEVSGGIEPQPGRGLEAGSNAAPATTPAETGKISRAAQEGLSTLGDSTADVVRTVIGTMIYWLPGVAVLIAGIWWYRRRATAAANEPPPDAE